MKEKTADEDHKQKLKLRFKCHEGCIFEGCIFPLYKLRENIFQPDFETSIFLIFLITWEWC